ncbi:MAG: bifunctional hydroxymethylpyrimidine kinase/phosphomethylpyrimidine kinase, partial [Lactobacillus crispatus]|nr:bifunctional hydroxymethylpyrimidine kinase/phosphomethylpyrimidine kinase [Lactobacillus crispatus]MCT7699800.1 bifunctional hydroxymethylpyrimidine kinase/phosphomethylpyrimidine kinase [Lactobacillus crispatus]
MEKNQKIAVTIAGNDSDGSAGMPADLHSFYARGVYGMGLMTAAVAGNTKGIFAQQIMPCLLYTSDAADELRRV